MGNVIGRGVPGYVFSKDFVIRDDTGIIFLDYEQPLAIFNFWFSIMRTGNFIGQEITVHGWYRRGPMPFIEIYKIESGLDTSHCYVYFAKLFFGTGMTLIGFLFWFSKLGH
jgi:hypothetical protein